MTRPTFASNRDGETVAGALNALFEDLIGRLKEPPDVAIASAYFNPGLA